jgi:glycine betaine/proline transport system ATP-binding protein
MQTEVIRLQEELGKTMIFITHDLDEALKVGDRIAIMRDGAVVQTGTAEELIANPVDEYVADFTRDIPKSHVLTAKTIARPLKSGEQASDRTVDANTVIRDVTATVLTAHGPVNVVSNGQSLGVIDAEDILRLISVGVN